jgi:hypothetical protein
MSISDFGKTPEAGPTENLASVGTISLTNPPTKPKPVPNPAPTEAEVALKVEEKKSDFEVAKTNTPPEKPASSGISLGGPVKAAPTIEDIVAGVIGNIGDKIGSQAKLKILLYGDPGSMKSSLAATAPNNLVADLEDGLMAAKFAPFGVADNVRPYPWKGFADFANLVGALSMGHEALDWVETFTVDSLSEVHRRALAEVTTREHMQRPGSVNQYVAETEHHQENNERILRMIRALRDMNKNLILIAHATTVEPKGKQAKTYPDFSEKLANKIEGMMDVVGYCEKKMTEDGQMVQVVRFKSDDGTHCKTRIPLPAEVINPNMQDLLRIWEESKNA